MFNSRREALLTRITAHAGGEFLLGRFRSHSPVSLLPGIIIMTQGPSLELNLGTALKYQQNKSNDFAFRIGFWVRNVADYKSSAPRPESFILNAGIEFSNLQFGFSYDANISSISVATQGQGAFEASIIYTNPHRGKKAQGCPAWN
jgi:hypothetical protein